MYDAIGRQVKKIERGDGNNTPIKFGEDLKAVSTSTEVLNISMYNMVGLKVQQIRAMPGQMMRLGDHIVSGTYLIEVRQGDERAMVKVVKH